MEEAARTGKPISYEEYLCTPLTRKRYEIIDGVVHMSPAPTSYHQGLIFRLCRLLDDHVTAQRLGLVLPAPVDVIIERGAHIKARQPDALYLSRARSGVRRLRDLRDMPQITVTPDLVIEMLSPDETRRTLDGKLRDYAAIGVPEVWPISSEAQTVEVLRLENGQYVRSGLYGVGDIIVSNILPGLNLSVDTIFAEEDEDEEEDEEDEDVAGEEEQGHETDY
jgi:Uma2 family endonuclease